MQDRGRSPRRQSEKCQYAQHLSCADPAPAPYHHPPAQAQCSSGSGGSGASAGSLEEEEYPHHLQHHLPPVPVPLSRRPSLIDIEFSGPGRDVGMMYGSRLSGLNSLPRSLHDAYDRRDEHYDRREDHFDRREDHFDRQSIMSREDAFDRREYMRREREGPSSSYLDSGRGECYVHQSAALIHHHQCHLHDLSGSEEDEPEPGYATGTVVTCTLHITLLRTIFYLLLHFIPEYNYACCFCSVRSEIACSTVQYNNVPKALYTPAPATFVSEKVGRIHNKKE